MEDARNYIHSLFQQLSAEYESDHLALDDNDESDFLVDDIAFHVSYNDDNEVVEVASNICDAPSPDDAPSHQQNANQ